jgi:hypothetical protein
MKGFDLFSPPLRVSSRVKKGRSASSFTDVSGLRLRARSPPAIDRHRGNDGRGLK